MINKNNVSGKLGKNTFIGKYSVIDKCTTVGTETFINTNCMITKATIGNYCSIGSDVVIGPGEHQLDTISTSSRLNNNTYEELTKKPCEISHDVWIGTKSIILRGVKIGTGAVIGAGSVVTKDVPAFAIVAGVPAKIIKYRFDKNKQDEILKSKYFLYDFETALNIIERLNKNDNY